MTSTSEIEAAHRSLNNNELFMDMSAGMVRALRAFAAERPEHRMTDPVTGEQWPASVMAQAFENIVNETRRRIAVVRADLPPLPPESGVRKPDYTPGIITLTPDVPRPQAATWSQESSRIGEALGSEEAKKAYKEGLEAGQRGTPREDNPYPNLTDADFAIHMSWSDGWDAGSDN